MGAWILCFETTLLEGLIREALSLVLCLTILLHAILIIVSVDTRVYDQYCPWNLPFPFCFVDVPGEACNDDWELNLPRMCHNILISPLHLKVLLVLGQLYFHQHYRWHFSGDYSTPKLISMTLFVTWLMSSAPHSAFLTLYTYEFLGQGHSYLVFPFAGLFCHWSHFLTLRAICWSKSHNILGSVLCQAVGVLCPTAGPPLTSHEQERCLETV